MLLEANQYPSINLVSESVNCLAWIQISFKRAVFIAPGVYLAGLRGKELALASVYGSIGVSLSLVAYFLMNPNYTTDLCEVNR